MAPVLPLPRSNKLSTNSRLTLLTSIPSQLPRPQSLRRRSARQVTAIALKRSFPSIRFQLLVRRQLQWRVALLPSRRFVNEEKEVRGLSKEKVSEILS